MLTYKGLALTSAVLLTLVSTASIAEFRRSEIQEAENNIYIAIGGGGGGMNTGDWKKARNNDDPFNSLEKINQPNHKTVGTGNGMAAIGYGFQGFPARLEVAYNYIGNGSFEWDNIIAADSAFPLPSDGARAEGKAKVFSNTVMLNAYLDFIMNERWMPFLMIGAGWGVNGARLDVNFTSDADPSQNFESSSDRKYTSNFVWNAGVGVNYVLDESWTLGVAATYFYLGEMDVNAFDPLLEEDISAFTVDTLDAFIGTVNLAYHW